MTSRPHHAAACRAGRSTAGTAQRGAILLITLVSLVILLLAATALLRSTNTAALIAGNLALRQSTVASSDRAVTDAVTLLANFATNDSSSPWTNASNVFNKSVAPYYSYVDTTLNLTAASTWQDGVSSTLNTPDASGNQSRYIIQRMCRTADQVASVTDCLINYSTPSKNDQKAGLQQAQQNASNMVFRITVRTIGPKNTISYTQAFVN